MAILKFIRFEWIKSVTCLHGAPYCDQSIEFRIENSNILKQEGKILRQKPKCPGRGY